MFICCTEGVSKFGSARGLQALKRTIHLQIEPFQTDKQTQHAAGSVCHLVSGNSIGGDGYLHSHKIIPTPWTYITFLVKEASFDLRFETFQ